jgi:hypothetical protein
MVRSPTGRSTTQLSMAYLPETSDLSLDIPSFGAGAITDTTMQLPAMDDDASFQIPIAANQSDLLHMGDTTFIYRAYSSASIRHRRSQDTEKICGCGYDAQVQTDAEDSASCFS